MKAITDNKINGQSISNKYTELGNELHLTYWSEFIDLVYSVRYLLNKFRLLLKDYSLKN